MPRIGPAGEIIINGWLSKTIAGIATAGVVGGFIGLLTATSLAGDYKQHKSIYEAKVEQMWETAIRQEAFNERIQENRLRAERIERKLDALLNSVGINPAVVEKHK